MFFNDIYLKKKHRFVEKYGSPPPPNTQFDPGLRVMTTRAATGWFTSDRFVFSAETPRAGGEKHHVDDA